MRPIFISVFGGRSAAGADDSGAVILRIRRAGDIGAERRQSYSERSAHSLMRRATEGDILADPRPHSRASGVSAFFLCSAVELCSSNYGRDPWKTSVLLFIIYNRKFLKPLAKFFFLWYNIKIAALCGGFIHANA